MYKIEKNVPMPTARRYAKGMTDAIRRMEVGDSFVIEKAKRRSAYAIAWSLGDRKISVREVDGPYRVWRIA